MNAESSEFLVVGAHAVMFHTAPRFTKDLDIWIHPTSGNAEKVLRALARFGAPASELTIEDLTSPGTIFMMGIPPNRIDILTTLDGLDFESAWKDRVRTTYGGVAISLLSIDHLIVNKRTVGRAQDLVDVESLERARESMSRG
ncbi:MAG: hypothetical protein HY791_37620 [Deltaproteobacteria bacterium]|nr:hypothetical protein [Deltaproteobacteria bacterium]